MAHHHHHYHTIAFYGPIRIWLMLTPSTMPLFFCGSILFMLAAFSLIVGPLLDIELSIRHHGHHEISLVMPQPKQIASMSNISQNYATSVVGPEILPNTIWASSLASQYYGCGSPSDSFASRVPTLQSNGYIFVETSGGLNQQRIGIVDAVIVARLLNATLIVPFLDHESFWGDKSNFSDIFDVEWFTASLAPDVNILKEIPARSKIKREMLYSTRAPRRSEPEYYIRYILPLLKRKKAIRLTKFDYRLSSGLDEGLQKLRCRVNYHALRFTEPITNMGKTIIRRLRQKGGRYIALHLRFEPDVLAFTGCYYGGGEKEIRELGLLRKRWETLADFRSKTGHRSGKCPLTPEEVGWMLRALGFANDTHIYVASAEVYGGESNLAPLKALFPHFHTKDTLTTSMELEPFAHYTNRMAAIDYIVSEESDVFITNYNGNMVKVLAGSRRYHGHKRTIQPNVKKLGSLFLSRKNMTWQAFSTKLRRIQRGYIGDPNERRPGGDFFEYPDSCLCRSKLGNMTHVDMLHHERNSDDAMELDAFDEHGTEEVDQDILHLQYADLINEANAGGGDVGDKEMEEISFLSE
ncbi:hypothetical protein KP509_26G071200 [Ceratopteris richardii]|uniref:O-fucosyltransferase family protein n=1 Tax=Ceratopteris richardii TaxID=49495 RepID=A0A8T2RLV8_CERRI|nr:hypothetical protein KP509_26G071200 [Ceratopteris richardii]KAH7297482.1 hypothetical protein KP509_26G071200 [Ceratopteris richardii]KAH7297483.1 hypothetical protein KP509_26G071200 [Ceratopteris richardii]